MHNLRLLAAVAGLIVVLAACQGGTASHTAQASLGAGEGEVDLVIWTGYAERGDNDPNYDWVTPFESKTGCKVKTQDGTDSANMVQLMQSGAYDGVSASGDATKRLIAAGLVSPINPALIPNYANIFDSLKLKDYNSVNGVPYGVPHGRGANLLLYNTDTFTTAPTSWDVVFKADSPAAGKISIYNSAIYIADAAMYLKAHNADLKITNPYELDQAQFDAAVKLLKDQKKIVGQYWSTAEEQMQSFTSKDSLAGTSWPYQANLLTDQPIGQTIPSEGATGWSDTWMISSTAKHPNCMYMWMDWMASPDANAQATVWFGEAPTSAAACAKAETLDPGHCDKVHATDESYYSKIYYWTTPLKECGDNRGAVCKDFGDWTTAWTDITGS